MFGFASLYGYIGFTGLHLPEPEMFLSFVLRVSAFLLGRGPTKRT